MPDGERIRFDPAPGIIIEAQFLPGVWLMLVALGLILIGATGYLRRTSYLLLQLAPWPMERTITVAQSDSRNEISAIQKVLT